MEGVYTKQRIEALEAERDEAIERIGRYVQASHEHSEARKKAEQERDEALAAKERVEAELSDKGKLLAAEVMLTAKAQQRANEARQDYEKAARNWADAEKGLLKAEQERDEALAAKERAEAERDEQSRLKETQFKRYIEASVSLDSTKQQLSEALAQNEALRGALDSLEVKHMHNCFYYGAGGVAMLGECHRECQDRKRRQALALTPPQALAQQRERMERLEKVVEVAGRQPPWGNEIVDGLRDDVIDWMNQWHDDLVAAVAALVVARKGER